MTLYNGQSLYGSFRTRTFNQIWEDAATFLADWKASGLYKSGLVTDDSVTTLFYLLTAKYANDHISSSDENQFKYKVYANIYQYGPSWEKRLSIQASLRGLTEAELLQGSKAIHNHAYNPSTTPGTDSLTELSYIDDQNTTNYKRSKIEAYEKLWSLIKFDVTSDFLSKFDKLFMKVVSPEYPLYYVEEEE